MFTIEQIFQLFGLHGTSVLQLLHGTSSIISGSAALLALLPWSFEPNDLDIFVPNCKSEFVIQHIQDIFGFRLTHTSLTPYRTNPEIAAIHWFEKDRIKINVITSTTDNALEPLFHFHSTALMNFISSTGIYCAYPTLTLSYRSLPNANVLVRGQKEGSLNKCLDKYRERGFTVFDTLGEMEDMANHICSQHPCCPHTLRSIYDHGGLYYEFEKPRWMDKNDMLRINGAESTSVWTLGANRCNSPLPSVHVSASALLVQTVRPLRQ